MKNIIAISAIILSVQGAKFLDYDVDKSIMHLSHQATSRSRLPGDDGSQPEVNQEMTRDELERFYHPKVFGSTIEDIHNTHNGKLPGHHRAGVDDEYQPRSIP